jgi:rhamnulokinase
MLSALGKQLEETGQAIPSEPTAVARVVLDSLALRYASVLRAVTAVTGRPIPGVRIVGGGSRNAYLNQVTATACDCPVLAGPVEATVIGNALVQAIAHGRFPSLTAAREHVAANISERLFVPAPSTDWARVQERYRAIESRYTGVAA